MTIVTNLKRLGTVCLVVAVLTSAISGGVVSAVAPAAATNTSAASSKAAAQTALLQKIQTKGAQELARRVKNLQSVQTKIASSTKLTAADQTTLTNEVTSELTGLQTLQTQLTAATTVPAAVAIVQQMVQGYRVYALVLPKIYLVKTADNQQITEAKLTTFTQRLQTRLTAAQTSGKNVTALQADLTTMTGDVNSAQAISAAIESGVIALQPTDYNSNHTVLGGDSAKLKTALTDEQSALTQAQTIVQGLASL